MADLIFPGEAPIDDLGVERLPGNMDLSIWKGDAQTYVVAMTDDANVPLDLTGCTAQAVIRAGFTDPTTYPFACSISANRVTLYMSSAVCKTIPPGNYVWNFQITSSNGDVRTYLAGDVLVYAEVDG